MTRQFVSTRKWILILMLGFAFAVSAGAQEHAKPVAPEAQQHEQAATTNDREQSEGPGAELTEASREAAGEENDQFKNSASVRWLAAATGMKPITAYWFSVGLNFAVIALLLIFILKSRLPGAFRARTESIRKSLDEARRASELAQKRLADIEARLSKLDAEIGGMRAAAEAEAKQEEERIRTSAEKDKQKIIADAEQEIAAAANLARRELKAYVATLAVDLAEQRIQINPATDEELVRSFVDELGKNGQ